MSFAGVLMAAKWGDDGDVSVGGGGLNGFDLAVGDLADSADVFLFSLVVGGEELFGFEDGGAVDGFGLAAEFVDGFDEAVVDGAVEGFVDDFDRFGGGDAVAADEFGFEPACGHDGGDGFSSSVDDDGADAGDFEEDDVSHDFTDEFGIVHGGASHFDEEGLSAEALEVGEGFDEDGGLFGCGSHESCLNEVGLA